MPESVNGWSIPFSRQPVVIRATFLSMQVCVPEDWTDDQAEAFANAQNPAGIASGWVTRKEGDSALAGCHAHVPCAERPEFVHIMLDC